MYMYMYIYMYVYYCMYTVVRWVRALGVHPVTPPNHVPSCIALVTRLRIVTTVGYGIVICIWVSVPHAGGECSARYALPLLTTHAFLGALRQRTVLCFRTSH